MGSEGTMRLLRFSLVLAVVVMVSQTVHGEDQPARGGEQAKLETFFHDYLQGWFRNEPLAATRLGEHAFDDRLDDLSPDARKRNLAFKKQALAALPRTVSIDKLTRDGQIDFEIFQQHLAREVWLAENFRPFEDDPRIYGDYISESVYLLLTQSSLAPDVNLKNALARMEQIPAVIADRPADDRQPSAGQGRDRHPPDRRGHRVLYHGAVRSGRRRSRARASSVPRHDAVVAALKDYLGFLKTEVLPRSTESWRIGPDRFVKKLDLELDAGIPADEVLAEAEREADRVETEMGVIARQLWGTLIPGQDDPSRRSAGPSRADPPRPRGAGRRSRPGRHAWSPMFATPPATIKAFIRAAKILRSARARPVPDHRDARVQARQLGGLPEPGAAARSSGARASTRSARHRPTGPRSGPRASCGNTTGRCSRS